MRNFPGPRARRRLNPAKRRRGYVLVALTLAAPLLLGVVGLAVDIGRMYVVKSEAQSFVDAAALNAAVKLAISPGTFNAAADAAAQTPKGWEFGNHPFTNVVTLFGTGPADTFVATPPGAGHKTSDYTFAKVTANVSLQLYLLPIVVRSTQSPIAATAIAGPAATTSLPGGELPFSPYSRKAHTPDDANDPFGFKAGNSYTLRWEPPGDKTGCGTDNGKVGSKGQFRGYCCTGAQSVPSVRDVLAGKGTVPINVGDPFGPLEVNGQKNSINIDDFVGLDTDQSSPTYAAYLSKGTGNGKRLVLAPVNDGQTTVVGFAAFFLEPYGQNGGKNVCAEYIGSYVQGLPGLPPESGSGVWHMRLFQ